MVIFRNCGVFVWSISTLLLAGCATHPQIHDAGGKPPSAAAAGVDENKVQAYAHYVQGMMYDMELKPDLAQEELAQAAMLDPSNEDLVLDLTRRYLHEKQFDKALVLLQRATSVPDASGALFAQLGMVYSHLGKEAPAIAACQKSIKLSPDLADGYRVLFFVQLQRGRPADARKVLEQALKVADTAPEFIVEVVDLCSVYERQAPLEKSVVEARALVALNRAAAQNPAEPRLRQRMADDYSQLGATTNATKMYLQLLAAYEDQPALRDDVREKLARIYLRDNNYAKASGQIEAIVQDDPANADAYTWLGSLAEEQKKLPQAEEYYRKALILGDTRQAPYYDLARVQIDLNEPGEAIATLDGARHRFPDNYLLEVLSAEAFEKQKDFTNAVNHFTTAEVIAKATDPKLLNEAFYFFQGAASERAGDYEQAEKCFEKSLELKPDSAEALNYLGYMWADHGVKLDRALDLIEQALKIEPKSPAYLDSLGWVLYKLNRPQEALPNIQKAIELSEEPDPTLYEHLGDIFAMLKQTDRAREAWSKSLKLEPNELIRKKLQDATKNFGPEKSPATP
jgi:tetratricopeptide (TPR) repeat protein